MRNFLWLLILLFSTSSWAAPYPATGSSLMTNPEKGLFFGGQGFQLGTLNSRWILNSTDSENQVRYSHSESDTASVMVRSDELAINSSLETYAKKWMKDYSSYGFDVLGARTFSEKSVRGMVVDLMNKAKQKQVRQAIYVKDKKAVIITCMDDPKSFLGTLSQCNQLIKNFSWLEITIPTNF